MQNWDVASLLNSEYLRETWGLIKYPTKMTGHLGCSDVSFNKGSWACFRSLYFRLGMKLNI